MHKIHNKTSIITTGVYEKIYPDPNTIITWQFIFFFIVSMSSHTRAKLYLFKAKKFLNVFGSGRQAKLLMQ